MNRLLLFLFVTISVITSSFAQTQVNLFYNNRWQITEKEKAYYFRNCIILASDTSIFIGPFKDFSVEGKLLTTGYYNAKGKKEGEFTFYHVNGQVEAKGNFKNNVRVGLWDYWYPDGKKKYEVNFHESDIEIKNYWDENGQHRVKDGNGTFEEYIPDSRLLITGQVLNNKREGKWTSYLLYRDWKNANRLDSIFYNAYYKDGKFKRVVYHAQYGINSYSKEEPKQILKIPEKLIITEIFGYDYKLFGRNNYEGVTDYVFTGKKPWYTAEPEFYSDNIPQIRNILNYCLENPDLSKDILLVVEATLQADGTLTNFQFQNEPELRLKRHVISVLSKINGLIPQKEDGIPIASKIIIPVQKERIYKNQTKSTGS